MKASVKLSIIIPAYNASAYIEECLTSIIDQKADNYEVVVIDDGSTDDTLKKCKALAEKDKKIKVFHQHNSGVSSARNLGIKKAAGKWIWFVDSDDLLTQESLSVIIPKLEHSDLQVISIEEFDRTKSKRRLYKNEELSRNELIIRMLEDDDIKGYPFNKIFKKSIIKNNRLFFDESIDVCEDLLFCVKYANCIKKARTISDVLYRYRQSCGGAIHKKLNNKQATALDAFLAIERMDICPEAKNKVRALCVKAYYKYRPLFNDQQKANYKKEIDRVRKQGIRFSRKDCLLTTGYRFFNPFMRLLHRRQYGGTHLYAADKHKDNSSSAILLFLIFIAFYLGVLHVGAITPIIVMGGVTFLYNIYKKYRLKRRGITKVETLYFCFVTACIILSFFAYDKAESIKQIIKILTLIFISWQFIVIFRNSNKKTLEKTFTAASFAFFITTLALYIIGLIDLGFDFGADHNVFSFGVMIDRNVPRLLSLAYYDPNLTALFLFVPLAFFLSKNDTVAKKICLFFAAFLVGLTGSRGAYLSLALMGAAYLFFGDISFRKRILLTLGAVLCAGVGYLSLFGLSSIPPKTSINRSTDDTAVVEGMFNDETSIINPAADHFGSDSYGGSGRLELWTISTRIIKKHPLTGVGLNNTYSYMKNELNWGKYIHNTYLEIIMEEGLIGGVLYIATIIAIIVACWRVRKTTMFPALLFVSLLSAQVFLSACYSEVFFAGLVVLSIASHGFKKSYLGGLRSA